MSGKDTIYRTPQTPIAPFEFDERVAAVFDDMLRRSVPGYELVLRGIGTIAQRFVAVDSNVYDFGCSLGGAAMATLIAQPNLSFNLIAVDNAEAMCGRCEDNLAHLTTVASVDIRCADIADVAIENASLVLLNLTLQFVPPSARDALIQRIADGIRPGGALVLTEKVLLDEAPELFDDLHLRFKQQEGYSELEIAQKRTALENVLQPETVQVHAARLRNAGFSGVYRWFQAFNFVSWIAVK